MLALCVATIGSQFTFAMDHNTNAAQQSATEEYKDYILKKTKKYAKLLMQNEFFYFSTKAPSEYFGKDVVESDLESIFSDLESIFADHWTTCNNLKLAYQCYKKDEQRKKDFFKNNMNNQSKRALLMNE